MRINQVVLAACLSVSSAFCAVDPALLALVMPGARIVGGVQVDQSQASPFGRYILSQVQPGGAQWDQFVAATGFDPRRDLHELVIAAVDNNSGLVLGRGVFQPAKIGTVASLAGGKVTAYRGIEMVTANDQMALGFLDASTVALGKIPMVKAAIDRRLSGGTWTGPLAQKAVDVALRSDAWVVTAAPIELLQSAAAAGMNLSQANLLESVREVSAGVKFGTANVVFNGEAATRSDKDAQALADVLRFLASMVQVNRNKGNTEKAAALVDSAKFSSEGSVMRLSIEIPEKQAEELFTPQGGARRLRAVR